MSESAMCPFVAPESYDPFDWVHSFPFFARAREVAVIFAAHVTRGSRGRQRSHELHSGLATV